MKLDGALRAMLLADPKVTALVGDRVYLWQMPEPTPYPAITHFLVSEIPIQGVGGLSGSCEATVQVSSWARAAGNRSGASLCRELAQAVRGALVGKTFTDPDSTVTVQVTYEDSTQVFPPDLDTDVWQFASTLTLVYTEKAEE